MATANLNYKELLVNDGLEGIVIVRVLKASVLVSDPRAAVLTMGQVNAAASPYPVTDEIKAALPAIQFLYA